MINARKRGPKQASPPTEPSLAPSKLEERKAKMAADIKRRKAKEAHAEAAKAAKARELEEARLREGINNASPVPL